MLSAMFSLSFVATPSFAVITVNRRSFAGAMLERRAHYTWERPCMRDYWVVIVQNLSVIRSISDQLCHAVGPLVLPIREETNVFPLHF